MASRARNPPPVTRSPQLKRSNHTRGKTGCLTCRVTRKKKKKSSPPHCSHSRGTRRNDIIRWF
ncbi:hypothetical protein B0H10DRAFT_2067893 [Mycena sp. CBHHK59/15]|nr:hypothetical protein B0H10DRAFT_2069137 [Mycena sp. CBHHK59/15]KAJ6608415.1 hypothetical protein B0H10DRAFT_2067893 [Mycena sp. CBHHK59/15]